MSVSRLSAAGIAALLDAREAAVSPGRTRHLGFGDIAAVWGMLDRLDVIATIDEVVGARRSDAGASVGAYLALAALRSWPPSSTGWRCA
ncbi:MAG: hypothetical protein ABIZ05_11895 [Pseudonocardiaceae bacterium]